MNEELISFQEQSVEIQQTFKPFKGIVLPEIIAKSKYYREIVIQLRGGIDFTFTLESDLAIEGDSVPHEKAKTPLGKVKETKSYVDGRFLLEEVPLHLSIESFPEDIEAFALLKRIALKLNMGDEEFLLFPESVDREKNEEYFKETLLKQEFYSCRFRYKGNDLNALLPWNANRLATIEAKIVPTPKRQ